MFFRSSRPLFFTFRTGPSTRVPSANTFWPPASPRSTAPPKAYPKTSDNIGNFVTKFSSERAQVVMPSDPETVWKDREGRFVANLPRPQNAYSGRAFTTNKDFYGAYADLSKSLARNSLVYELRLADRHEKKGAKRRRLASERWRTRFAHEVRKKVQLVNEIRARGA